jgi:hypothetical protein
LHPILEKENQVSWQRNIQVLCGDGWCSLGKAECLWIRRSENLRNCGLRRDSIVPYNFEDVPEWNAIFFKGRLRENSHCAICLCGVLINSHFETSPHPYYHTHMYHQKCLGQFELFLNTPRESAGDDHSSIIITGIPENKTCTADHLTQR